GYEATCRLRVGETVTAGKAVLEQHDLIFRGPTRLAIPLTDITSAIARDGLLTVRFGRTTAAFDLGRDAVKWANRITSPPSRLDKLGVKAQMTVRIVGPVDADLIDEIRSREARILRTTPPAGADLVFYAVDRRERLERMQDLKTWLKPNGALWVIRPKGSPAITESEVMAAGKRAGLVDVKVASFSPTHTAEKFVI